MNRLTFQLRKHFTILPYHYMKRAEYVFEPVLDLYARKFRKMALDSSILEKNRLVIPANRTRGIDDTLLKLKKNHETAGVIFARGNLPEVNFVLDNRQGFSLHRIKHHLTQHYYVRIPETQELIRVLIDKIEIIDRENWVPWIHFNRYIVGKPNLLYLPIKIRMGYSNKFLNAGGMMTQKIEGIHVYSYNDDYPTVLEIDPHNVSPVRQYSLGDLVNTLPDGVVIHPKYKDKLTAKIFNIKPNTSEKLIKRVKEEQQIQKEETGQTEDDLLASAKLGEDLLKKEGEEKPGRKGIYDRVVDRKTKIEEKDIDETEKIEEHKTFSELKKEESISKRKEIREKLGKKTPFKNIKKTILEDYSLKESIKEEIENKEKEAKEMAAKAGEGTPGKK